MMQTFRITDALRCVVLNAPKGPNLASPVAGICKETSFQNLSLWKQVLTQRDHRITLAWWDGIQLGGLVSARTRSGARVWETDHFYLPTLGASPDPSAHKLSKLKETATLELLEHLVQEAGCHSAERIFLRLPSGHWAIPLVQRTGFFPYFEEVLVERPSGYRSGSGILPENTFRTRQQHDEYGLFQLFSASTPAPIRVALGVTCDQWKDAQEPCCRGREEWLSESNGKIVGWLARVTRNGATECKLMVHPDHPNLLADIIQFATSTPGPQRWLVPNYQGSVCNQLSNWGFQEKARYTLLIKTVAAPVLRPGMATVEA